jgi:Concanavalin A-like lectin/glucanases superfamily
MLIPTMPGFVATLGVALSAFASVVALETPAVAAPATHIWQMDESAGDGTMHDSGSPTQTNGTWRNIQAGVPGFSGTAYRFNGTSRVTVNDNSSLDPGTSDFTITLHVNFTAMPDASVGGDFDLIRKGLGSTSGGYWKVEIYPNSSHTKALGLCQMKGTSHAIKIKGAPSSLNDGNWHTITCAKTSSDVTLTVDGTNYRRTVTIGSISNSAVLTLGSKSSGDDWYSGDMDAVTFQIG